MNNRNDLTEGVIWKKLVVYFLPIVAGTLFQQLYNAVDAIVVGKFVGTSALAAVGGSPATLVNLLIGFFVALCSGAGVVIAQHHGAGNKKAVSDDIHTSITFCTLTGLALGALIVAFAEPILNVLKTPENTLDDAVLYTRIYFSGSVFMLIFNMGSGIKRALGDSRKPFIFLMISCVCNIALDLYFVIGLGMGVAGVAWATVIAQGVSAVCIVTDLFRADPDQRLRLGKLGIKKNILSNMMRIGIPAGLQSAMYGVSNMILQTGVNTLGTVVVASWSMSGKIDGVYWATAGAFGTAVTNFVGQNYGAGRNDRIKACVRTSCKLFLTLTVVLSVIILLLARPALGILTDDPEVVKTTWKITTYFVPVYILWTVIEIFSGVLRGVGDAVKPVIIVALGVCLVRVLWVFTVFNIKHTLFMLSVCYPVSWGVTDIALVTYYFRGSMFSLKKRRGENAVKL